MPAPALTPQDRSLVRDAPVFHPTAEEFADPVQYVLAIQDQAEPFGLCKIVPPPGVPGEVLVQKGD